MSDFVIGKLVSTNEDSIKEIGGGNIICSDNIDDEANVVGKISIRSLMSRTDLLTLGARLAFTKLKKAFSITAIYNYFDLKHYIQIKTDISDYAISGILHELIANGLGQWYPGAFFLEK